MKITTNLLKQVWLDAEFVSVSDIQFDWVDTVSTNTINYDWTGKNILSFLFYLPNPTEEGWYDVVIDKRNYLDKKHVSHEIVFVVDRVNFPNLEIKNNIIIVNDLFSFAKKLFDFVLKEVNPKIIGVTGSVGKTTAVSMLEDVLNLFGKTIRIYSKRISPLSLFSAVINNLDRECLFLVMEYSLYRRWHIEFLASLLKPDIAIFLNINKSHIGVDGIEAPKDIFNAKSKLLDVASIRMLADELSNFNYDKEVNFYFGKKEFSFVRLINPASGEIFTPTESLKIRPYVNTELGFKHVLACVSTLKILNLPLDSRVVDTIENFRPKEHRLHIYRNNQKVIVFDGEMSNGSRLYELSKNYYVAPILIILNVDFGEEPMDPQLEFIKESFLRFKKVYIAREFSGGNEVFNQACLMSNVEFVNAPFDHCSSHNEVFIHDGGYWRFRSDKYSPPIPVKR